MEAARDHWNDHARQWQHVGPPLRPAPADVRLTEALAAEVPRAGKREPLQAILLGVTPELACMRWPRGTRLLAVDRNMGMIEGVWPRDRLTLPASVVGGDWRELPMSDATAHLVVGDGCYNAMDSPEGYQALSAEVRRVLRPAGRFIMRFFVRPEQAESTEAVFTDLRNGRIGNFHVFKWRLAMSLHGSLDVGVRVGDVWEAWNAEGLEVEILSQRLNWPRAVIATIDAYRGVDTRYTFPTLEEVRASLADYFVELACHVPDYEIGERCPTLLMAPRGSDLP
jgi:SAM-dependent methyltransferase